MALLSGETRLRRGYCAYSDQESDWTAMIKPAGPPRCPTSAPTSSFCPTVSAQNILEPLIIVPRPTFHFSFVSTCSPHLIISQLSGTASKPKGLFRRHHHFDLHRQLFQVGLPDLPSRALFTDSIRDTMTAALLPHQANMPSYNAVDLDEVSSLPRYCFLMLRILRAFSAFFCFLLFAFCFSASVFQPASC